MMKAAGVGRSRSRAGKGAGQEGRSEKREGEEEKREQERSVVHKIDYSYMYSVSALSYDEAFQSHCYFVYRNPSVISSRARGAYDNAR